MESKNLKQMTFNEVKTAFRAFLQTEKLKPNTVNTASTDALYLWRNGDQALFWTAVESDDFKARLMLEEVLRRNSSGKAEKLVNSYLSHLRRFRRFYVLRSNGAVNMILEKEYDQKQKTPREGNNQVSIPMPSAEAISRTG